jgi:hypothetical protein
MEIKSPYALADTNIMAKDQLCGTPNGLLGPTTALSPEDPHRSHDTIGKDEEHWTLRSKGSLFKDLSSRPLPDFNARAMDALDNVTTNLSELTKRLCSDPLVNPDSTAGDQHHWTLSSNSFPLRDVSENLPDTNMTTIDDSHSTFSKYSDDVEEASPGPPPDPECNNRNDSFHGYIVVRISDATEQPSSHPHRARYIVPRKEVLRR